MEIAANEELKVQNSILKQGVEQNLSRLGFRINMNKLVTPKMGGG